MEKEIDAGKQYWDEQEDTGDRVFDFLQWATEVKRMESMIALYEMLTASARGPLLASRAPNLVATNAGKYYLDTP